MGLACGLWVRDGEDGVQLLGLLQHLPPRRRNPGSREEYPARDFHIDCGYRGAVPGDADEHSWRDPLARSAEFSVHLQRVRRETVRTHSSTGCDVDGLVDRPGLGVFGVAWLFARAVFGGFGREFFSGVRALASNQTFPACVAAGLGRACVSLQYQLEAGNRYCGDSFHAPARAIHRTGGGRDGAAAALGPAAIAVQDVVGSSACGADDDRVGVAFLADRGDAKMGSRGDRAGSPGVSHSRSGDATMAVWKFEIGSSQLTVDSKNTNSVSRGGCVNRLARAIGLAVPLLMAAPGAHAQFSPARGTGPGLAETVEAIDQARVTTRSFDVTAHPDDESSSVLTYLARGLHADVALLSLTRGEGGQNDLGPEQAPQLGLIRTQELLAATRGYGVKLFFTRAKDFGYSKTPEETEKVWGDQVLEDMVRVIRSFRPNIVINNWGGVHGGHGHHQAAGLLTPKAVQLAADPNYKTKAGCDDCGAWTTSQVLDIERGSE